MSNSDSIEALVGATPLMELRRVGARLGLAGRILAKLEFFNPAGSVKDRVAKAMIDKAELEGKLKPGACIIEPTSGNTGIALAAIGKAKGYRVIIVMPESMSLERRQLVKAYGAELELSPASAGMAGAIARTEELKAAIPGSVIMGQFENPANPEAHYNGTGPEIFAESNGNIDVFVAGVGTGGTISGVARYLKEKNPDIKIVAVEPADSPVLSGGKAGSHKIQGIGAGFVPANFDRTVVNSIMQATAPEAFEAARMLAETEGLLCGISSGAALAAAISVAKMPENAGKTVVVLLPDGGERYLSTELYS